MKTLILNLDNSILGVMSHRRAVVIGINAPHSVIVWYKNKTIKDSAGRLYQIPAILMSTIYVKKHTKVGLSKRNILLRDQYICQYCGDWLTNKTQSFDHVMPSSRGGENSWTNLVAACRQCNTRKGNKTPEEAGMKLLKEPVEPKLIIPFEYGRHTPKEWEEYLK